MAEGIASDLEIETLSITSRLKGKGSLREKFGVRIRTILRWKM